MSQESSFTALAVHDDLFPRVSLKAWWYRFRKRHDRVIRRLEHQHEEVVQRCRSQSVMPSWCHQKYTFVLLCLIINTSTHSLSVNIKPTARNRGVLFDTELFFIPHINKLVQSCFYQLRSVSRIKHMLTPPDLEKVIHAFIFSRLDYCNSLLSGINQKSLSRLQLVQNSAARLLTGFNRRQHITPILASLHWLPVCFRIDFKILLITFKACLGLALSYITDILIPYEP